MNYVILLVCLFLTLNSNADIEVPSDRYPTLQSAVDAIPVKGRILFTSAYTNELTVIQDKEIEIVGSNPNGASIIHTVRNLSQIAITVIGNAKVKLSNLNFIHGMYSIYGVALNSNRPDIELDQIYVNYNVSSSVTGPVKVITGEFRNVIINQLNQAKGEGSGIDLANFQSLELKNTSLKSKPGRGVTLNTTQNPVVVKINNIGLTDFEQGGIVMNNLFGDISLVGLSMYNIGRAGILVKNTTHVAIQNTGIHRGSGTNYFSDGIVSEQSSILLDNVSINYPFRYGVFLIACGDNARITTDITNTRVRFLQAGQSWASSRKTPCESSRRNWFPGGEDEDRIKSDSFEDDNSGNICVNSMSAPPSACSPFLVPDTSGY